MNIRRTFIPHVLVLATAATVLHLHAAATDLGGAGNSATGTDSTAGGTDNEASGDLSTAIGALDKRFYLNGGVAVTSENTVGTRAMIGIVF